MSENTSKWVYLFVLSLIWGSSFILMKKALIGVTPFQLGALRNIFTAFILFTVGLKYIKTIDKAAWKWIALSGVFGSFIPAFLFAIAETEIDSAIASILNSLVPLQTILVGFAVFQIASTKRQVFGVVLGFIGTALLVMEGSDLNPHQNYLYAGYIVLATVMYAFNVNIIKRHLQHLKPLTIATGNYVVVVIPACIILFFTGFFERSNLHQPTLKMALVYIFILSFFGTALAKVLFNKLIKISTPVFASSVTYVMPIVALTWGFLDGEGFSVLQGFASLIILSGVYLANKRA
ncbi:permease of the drug/metabolite transporter (DMT) superfamily [Formosa agariphila KMM 3901]|uniref:Permease of the drug/metabolite transporter (DMT) superfamily n=1 Tax=Formosa agariphila (strain DSM 15362 / KCTC 12365 / LMG 23005 / KMM 3901 / M-2Alg 35-1) TaxID=1347342 RepID=T2KQ40_FORAG|nr:EamA family transporter [Formosa agariphila]CDF80947.1 permease of the drug/metabolite transporter (DMT) superfamily [Formosa agariphila KMM 3901]